MERKLTKKWLKEHGFKCTREADKDRDEEEDGIWDNDGVTLYEDCYGGGFMFPTYFRENGEPKGGFSIEFEEQIELLYEAFRRKKLTKNDKGS